MFRFFFLLLLVILPLRAFTMGQVVAKTNAQPMSLKEAFKTLRHTFPGSIDALNDTERFYRANFKMAPGSERKILARHFDLFAQLLLNNHISVVAQSQTSPFDDLLVTMQESASHKAILVLTKAARDLFVRLKIKPFQQLAGGNVYHVDKNCLALLNVDDFAYPFTAANNTLMISPLYALTKSGHQLAPIAYKGSIVEDFALVITNVDEKPEINFYAGKFGKTAFTASRESYLLPNDDYQHVCEELGCIRNNDYGFLPLFSDVYERLGFLYEAHTWIASALPGLELSDAMPMKLLEMPTPSTSPDAEVAQVASIESDENAISEEIQELLTYEETRIRELRAKKEAQKANARQSKARGNNSQSSTSSLAVVDVEQDVKANREEKIDRITRGRKKFRQIRKYLNTVVKNCAIVSRQEGSHIVLSSETSAPISIVKRHGKRKTLSANEVQDLLTAVTTMAKK